MTLPKGVMQFSRSENPFVSIVLTTRGRPALACQAIDSLYSLAVRKDKLEFLFRVDSDDEDSVHICAQLVERLPNASLIVEQRGMGYLVMHQWYNRLIKMARGDWLMLWNDDALMQTDKWDEVLEGTLVQFWHQCPDIAYIHAPTMDRLYAYEFFFLRRKVFELLGRLSLSPHADNWVMRVMSQVKSAATQPLLKIQHKSHEMEDATRKDSVAAYGEGVTAKLTLESAWAQQAIKDDANKLREYIYQYHKNHGLPEVCQE